MKYLLSCAHASNAIVPEHLHLYMVCPVCATRRKLLAVECREWHFRCLQCTYSRFAGQSEDIAKHLWYKHRVSTGHDRPQIDYLVVEYKRKYVRNAFGRRVRWLISETRPPVFDPKQLDKFLPVQDVMSHDTLRDDTPPPF